MKLLKNMLENPTWVLSQRNPQSDNVKQYFCGLVWTAERDGDTLQSANMWPMIKILIPSTVTNYYIKLHI